jgi:hypothetical protein
MTEHDNADEVTRLRAEVARLGEALNVASEAHRAAVDRGWLARTRTEAAEGLAQQWRDKMADFEERAESAEAEVERLRRNTAGLYERTHAAEAAVTRVRELADEWERVGKHDRAAKRACIKLRAAMDPTSPATRPSPAPADDEGTGTGAAPSEGHSEAHFLVGTSEAWGSWAWYCSCRASEGAIGTEREAKLRHLQHRRSVPEDV